MKIIIGYDGSSDARAAADWALDEAQRTGLPVEFVYADEWPFWLMPSPVLATDQSIKHAIATMLRRAVAEAERSHPAVQADWVRIRAHAAPALIERSADAALLVVGGRGHSAVAGLLGSVAAAVGAHAHCPVVIARGDPDPAAPVVAGVDDSPAAAAVLRFAAEHALARGVPLRVIRAWPPVTGLFEDASWAARTVPASLREPFDALVTEIRDAYPGLQVRAEAVPDDPGGALERAAAGAQLLVAGSRGLGPVRGLLAGSVSQRLLRHSPCPVAVLHTT
ncbi:universal stress protein [Actinoplanes teichomyceticus]|uniref:Nucleotide-binding universal stress UspA family protein n=1 Tax=Actinoplanes teichomyceticus TaxID=1867 RepID=A0A561VLM2_ACTTI|nr:universal stress protein [Actinoplanes teichomyceticus]TWG12513.1 nucleotide-binding universal stress UspA family protein [Actinoplanes teichomyceticus]GIF13877.1 universal stress protein [Actinoplanes teichomyceticus]